MIIVVVCLIKFHVGLSTAAAAALALVFFSIYNSHILSALRTLIPYFHSLTHSLCLAS